MSFWTDRSEGWTGEALLKCILGRAGIPVESNPATTLEGKAGHDVQFRVNGLPYLAEAKLDKMAAQTGNVALEYWNCRSNTPSGLTSTRSHLWVHIIPAPLSCYIARISDLQSFVKTEKPLRVISRGGDGNASLYLYEMRHILPRVFFGLDVTHPSEIPSLLEFLLNEPSPPYS